MSHPGSACASNTTLDVHVPSPKMIHPAGDHAKRGTDEIVAARAFQAQAAASPKGMTVSARMLTQSLTEAAARQLHKTKAVAAASGRDRAG